MKKELFPLNMPVMQKKKQKLLREREELTKKSIELENLLERSSELVYKQDIKIVKGRLLEIKRELRRYK